MFMSVFIATAALTTPACMWLFGEFCTDNCWLSVFDYVWGCLVRFDMFSLCLSVYDEVQSVCLALKQTITQTASK